MAATGNQQSNTIHTSTPMTPSKSTDSCASDVSIDSMHGYGDSWFESMNDMATQYYERKAATAAARPPMQNHGASWFHNFSNDWQEWQRIREDPKVRKLDLLMDSDDESCELGL